MCMLYVCMYTWVGIISFWCDWSFVVILFPIIMHTYVAAHIGVGISGLEGQQAVLSSDYSFGQFR